MINFADSRREAVNTQQIYEELQAFSRRETVAKSSLLEKKYIPCIYLKMSTRYMKKVYGGNVTLEKGDDTSDTEVPVTSNAKSKSFNVFDVVCKHYHRFIHL